MKTIIVTMSAVFLIMLGAVQADVSKRGIVSKISVEEGWIEINENRFRISTEKTKVVSEGVKLKVYHLKKGNNIYFVSDNSFVSKIQLIDPIKFMD